MDCKFVIHYTLYGRCYNGGFVSKYKFFENRKDLDDFIRLKSLLPGSYIIFVKE